MLWKKHIDKPIEDIDSKHKLCVEILINNIFEEKNFTRKINIYDMKAIFIVIDSVFFENKINKILNKANRKLIFSVNERLTKTGGRCRSVVNSEHLICFSAPIIDKLFLNNEKRYKMGGLDCYSKVECIHHIMCHELIHLIMFIECPKLTKKKKGHGDEFIKMMKNIFDHNCIYHQMLKCEDQLKNEYDFYSCFRWRAI